MQRRVQSREPVNQTGWGRAPQTTTGHSGRRRGTGGEGRRRWPTAPQGQCSPQAESAGAAAGTPRGAAGGEPGSYFRFTLLVTFLCDGRGTFSECTLKLWGRLPETADVLTHPALPAGGLGAGWGAAPGDSGAKKGEMPLKTIVEECSGLRSSRQAGPARQSGAWSDPRPRTGEDWQGHRKTLWTNGPSSRQNPTWASCVCDSQRRVPAWCRLPREGRLREGLSTTFRQRPQGHRKH